jgi:hypothetical protein
VGKISGIEAVRARELGRLFNHRWGPELPNDETGRRALRVALGQIVALVNAPTRAKHFIDLRCPWLVGAERDAELEDAFRRGPWCLSADAIAKLLDVDFDTRRRLAFRTIGATDCGVEDRKELRRQRRAEAERQRRARKKRANAAANRTTTKEASSENPRTEHVRGVVRDDGLPGEWWPAVEVQRVASGWGAFAGLSDSAAQRATSRALKELAALGAIETKFEKSKTGFRILTVRYRAPEG